jgi:hypothetical protein
MEVNPQNQNDTTNPSTSQDTGNNLTAPKTNV